MSISAADFQPSAEALQYARLLLNENDTRLAGDAIPVLEASGYVGALAGGNALDRTTAWIKDRFKQLCNEAGQAGASVLSLLGNPETSEDTLLVAVVADFLMHFIPGIASLPNPEFHGPTALAVLIVRTLKVK
jgi:hypothetical protein